MEQLAGWLLDEAEDSCYGTGLLHDNRTLDKWLMWGYNV